MVTSRHTAPSWSTVSLLGLTNMLVVVGWWSNAWNTRCTDDTLFVNSSLANISSASVLSTANIISYRPTNCLKRYWHSVILFNIYFRNFVGHLQYSSNEQWVSERTRPSLVIEIRWRRASIFKSPPTCAWSCLNSVFLFITYFQTFWWNCSCLILGSFLVNWIIASLFSDEVSQHQKFSSMIKIKTAKNFHFT